MAAADKTEKTYEIHGLVTGRNGRPLEGARVTVWWQRIREREELTAGETSEHGHYLLRYEVPEHAPQPLLLVVEALPERMEAPLFSPLTQATPDLEVDLHLEPPDHLEWATLVRSIETLINGIRLSDLVQDTSHQDLTFLSAELGKDTETLMRVAVSARLEAAFKVPAPAFYAFLRQHVPAALPSPLLDASQNFTLIDALVQNIGPSGHRQGEPTHHGQRHRPALRGMEGLERRRLPRGGTSGGRFFHRRQNRVLRLLMHAAPCP